jgi:alpha-beta hydrolase superfamily lysophospholipase
MPGMSGDAVFGDQATVRDIPLAPDAAGDAVATLVRVPAVANTRGAILLVHGWADYVFRNELIDHLRQRGFDVYGLDLRAYGRSIRPHQEPNFVTDVSAYFEELDGAARLIHEADRHDRLVVLGHSTGGLITALWAHARRAAPPMDALVLNSPWLDLAEPFLTRTVGSYLVRLLGRIAPKTVIRAHNSDVYGASIHASRHGEWDYDLTWKPLNAFPVRAGWLRAIRLGHRDIKRGLDVPVPVLVLHSDRSLLRTKEWSAAAMHADTVLDVAQTSRLAPRLGQNVDTAVIDGALHDVFLSAPEVRAAATRELDRWLDDTLPAG